MHSVCMFMYLLLCVAHLGEIDQIDHDLDHLRPDLPLRDVVQDLYSAHIQPRRQVPDHAGSAPPTRQQWTSFVSSCLFLVWSLCCLLGFGFCCDSFSMLCMYILRIYLDTYVRWSQPFYFLFFLSWGVRFVSVIVCISSCFFFICLFSSWGNLPLQSYWSLSCDHGLHCSDQLMWEQQQQQQQQQQHQQQRQQHQQQQRLQWAINRSYIQDWE